MIILLLIVSLIPAILIFFYLRGLKKNDPVYKAKSNRLLVAGVLCSLGVVILAAVLNLAWAISGLDKIDPLLNAFFHDFVLAAFVEEFVKYLTARREIKKYSGVLTRADIAAFTVMVAIGFDLLESIVYSLGTSPMQIIVRGICMPHIAYGFIVGYFIARSIETGKRSYVVPGFLISLLIHGCYNFFLSEEIEAINEYLGMISMALVIVDMIIVIRMLFWIKKESKKELSAAAAAGQDIPEHVNR